MSMLAARLDRAIKAGGVAIIGVSIGDSVDRATWLVYPTSLQASAQPIIDSFNPDDPSHDVIEKDAEIDSLKALQALARSTFELKTTAWTLAQFRDRIKQLYRSL